MGTHETENPTEFPHGIGKVARAVLALNGYTRYDQLTGVSAKELLKLHGIGPKAIRILEAELAARGQALADSETTGSGRKATVQVTTTDGHDT
ncbi:hypothetical protein [Rhizohabitans arisaemae]|uniref:hypothetical protein n=1 Tax=Rhizohabitans arisaemae TaxID=2720610 RepID=UPI0024B1B09C|nr:hypothetical protein [Rhizohabitans arisaemae]